MKKVAMTVVGVLALAASANAQGTWYTDRATWESLLPKRLMGLAISTLLITFIAAAAHADDVLTLGTATVPSSSIITVISTYTFNSSMILNSIGFVSSNDYVGTVYRYSINGIDINVDRLSADLASIDNGVRWFRLATPITLNATDVVRVRTKHTGGSLESPALTLRAFTAVPGFDITVLGNNQSLGAKTNSNLRVSALGASIAPEPGTLALALTGGCALVGMHIRRRRMSN
jgi:hypothetical protein